MSIFSYTIVPASGPVTSGTDYTGVHTSPERLAVWYRQQRPDAVEVAVWAGELDDRPANVAPLAAVA